MKKRTTGQAQINLYRFTCNVGGKPRVFRGHFDLNYPDNDYLLIDLEDANAASGKSELKITAFSTDPYSVKLWNLTAPYRRRKRAELASSAVKTEPTQTPSKTPNVNLQQQQPQSQHNPKPKTENEIREIVQKTIQRTISMPSLVGKGVNSSRSHPRIEYIKEYRIQFGRDRQGRADLAVLLNNVPFVIVECKRQGIVGKGKEQLESYLNATRARLGIFANDSAPDNWIYYDTSIGFDEIPRTTFNRKVRKALDTERDIETQAQQQKEQRIEKRAAVLVTSKAVEERAAILIETEAKRRVNENRIQGQIAQQLQQQIEQQRATIERQRQEMSSNEGCMVWGWILFAIAAFILIAVVSGS